MSTKRFPTISIGLLAASVAALVFIGHAVETHCAFGFGGFGCTAPFVGWGDTLLAAVLGLIVVSGVLVVVVIWRTIRWLALRRR